MRRIARLAILATFAVMASLPARAESPDLRFLLAKLGEALDAGLTHQELHDLRLDIGAAIKLQVLDGRNQDVGLQSYLHTLAAVDQLWVIMTGANACQVEKGAVRIPNECRALVDPLYRVVGIVIPDFSGGVNIQVLLQALLKELAKETDETLHRVK